jgi:hypothetical protein
MELRRVAFALAVIIALLLTVWAAAALNEVAHEVLKLDQTAWSSPPPAAKWRTFGSHAGQLGNRQGVQ